MPLKGYVKQVDRWIDRSMIGYREMIDTDMFMKATNYVYRLLSKHILVES